MKFMNHNFDKDNHMLLDVIYQSGKVDDKYSDFITIVYKNIETGEKKLKVIESPEMEIYFTKNEFRDYDYNKSFIELSKVDKHTYPYRNVLWEIAKNGGDKYTSFLKQCKETGNWSDRRKVHGYPYVFGSDIPIDTFYRVQWLMEYKTENQGKLNNAFMDIEVDGIDIAGFPTKGNCPINAVTLINEENKSSYTLLLNNKENPQIKPFIENIDKFTDKLHDMFDDSYGYLEYKFFMYDDERELIKDIFKLLNTLKPDFLLLWNGSGSIIISGSL